MSCHEKSQSKAKNLFSDRADRLNYYLNNLFAFYLLPTHAKALRDKLSFVVNFVKPPQVASSLPQSAAPQTRRRD